MPLLVIYGATTRCTGCAGAVSRLVTSSPHAVSAASTCMQAASLLDHQPVVNIVPFGACSFLSGNPCVPATPAPWFGPIAGAPSVGLSTTLTEAHALVCAVGGVITIADPGQHTVEIGAIVEPPDEPDEPDDDPGFWEELWDDGGLLLDVAAIALDVATVPSGESIAMIGARRAARKIAKQTLKKAIKRQQKKKRGPKPWPEGPHNQTIDRRIKELEAQGHTHTHGGPKKEEYIRIDGGDKQARRPDITTTDPNGKVYRENVGRTTADGRPVKRERRALEDIERQTGKKPGYTPYDK